VSESKRIDLPESLGVREGICSVHTSRTMMLDELTSVLDRVPAAAGADAYISAIIEDNALGKPTQTTRRRTAQRLIELYGLDPRLTLFRLLRTLWTSDVSSRAMLAFIAAAARDPLLREMTPFVVAVPVGTVVTPEQVAAHLGERYPGRFQASTAQATAQRLASSWGQVGLLKGKVKKIRSKPVVTPVVVTFALAIGFFCGLRGKLVLDSTWTRLLDRTAVEVLELTVEASRQGWLTYKAAGAVVEITFPGLLRPAEGGAAHVPD
jgi:hypothetical protein